MGYEKAPVLISSSMGKMQRILLSFRYAHFQADTLAETLSIVKHPILVSALLFKSIVFFLSLFMYFESKRERECVHTRGEGQKEEETESQAGSLPSVQSPRWGSNSQTVRSWPEPRSSIELNPLSHPGTPSKTISYEKLISVRKLMNHTALESLEI